MSYSRPLVSTTNIYFCYKINFHFPALYLNLVQNEMKRIATFSFPKLPGYFMKAQAWVTLALMLDDSRTRMIFLLHDLPGFTVKKH